MSSPHSDGPAREPHAVVDPLFLSRWSPRAFDGSPIPRADLLTLFEAARWAPSSRNHQPWRFVFAERGDAHWDRFLGIVLPGNRLWAANASALVLVLSDTLVDRAEAGEAEPSRSHSFDTGAAWASLALQAVKLGYHTRAMGGIDRDLARKALAIPERFSIEVGVAVGRRAARETLPEQLRGREIQTGRRALAELVFAGRFGCSEGMD